MKIYCYFYISDYVAGNMYVRRALSSSWCAGSSNNNKNEEVSVVLGIGIVKEKHKSNKFVLTTNVDKSWYNNSIFEVLTVVLVNRQVFLGVMLC
jgi:hypothetical protein